MDQIAEPVFPQVEMNIVPSSRPIAARVVSNDSCMNGKSASCVRHTVIDISDTPLHGTLHSGQAFGVIPPGTDSRGKPHKVRLYSLACPPGGEDGSGRHIATTTKRLIDEWRPPSRARLGSGDWTPGAASEAAIVEYRLFLGLCSNYLCGLRSGDEVMISGPNGKRFLLPVQREAHDYVFIATGTGIAPFRGMIMELLQSPDNGAASRIHLIAGSPYTTDLLYHRQFQTLAREHENFHYHTAISREPSSDGRGVYAHQLLDRHIDEFAPLLDSTRTLLYLCGIAGMETGVFSVLERHGIDGPYFQRKSSAKAESPDEQAALTHQAVRTSARCLVEVY